MSNVPWRTRKKSSVASCLCHTNSPLTLTTITSRSLSWATVLGRQYSANEASLAERLILSRIPGAAVWRDPDDSRRERSRPRAAWRTVTRDRGGSLDAGTAPAEARPADDQGEHPCRLSTCASSAR